MAAEEPTTPFSLAGPKPQPGEETPEIRRLRGANALSVAARLMAGAMTFFFLSFAFAYVYLKTSNIEGKWRPSHVAPVQAWGVVFVVCLVLSAVAMIVANRRQTEGKPWMAAGIACLVLGLLAILGQIIGYTQQTFGPSDDAYASVFIGWTGFYLLVALMSLYWIEIQVATESRELREQRSPQEGKVVYEHPDRLLPRGLDAATFFWTYLVGLGVIMWVLVYLVK